MYKQHNNNNDVVRGVEKIVDRVTEFRIPGAFLVTLRAPSDLLRNCNRKRIYIRNKGDWDFLLHNLGVKISSWRHQ